MLRVLIVDDAKLMRYSLIKILKSIGHEIVGEAEDGNIAYERYKELKPDLVTMDMSMPNLDGIGAVEKICEEFPEAKIIMVSSIEDRTLTYEAIAAGALDFINKPPQEDEVKEKISKIIK